MTPDRVTRILKYETLHPKPEQLIGQRLMSTTQKDVRRCVRVWKMLYTRIQSLIRENVVRNNLQLSRLSLSAAQAPTINTMASGFAMSSPSPLIQFSVRCWRVVSHHVCVCVCTRLSAWLLALGLVNLWD